MKRILKTISAGMLIVLAFTACGTDKTSKTIVIGDTMDTIVTAAKFEDQLIKLTDKTVSDFYEIDDKTVAEYEIRMSSSGATAEELAIFKLVDANSGDAVKKLIDDRKATLKRNFESYIPAEMARIDKAIVAEKDGYILFAIANEAETVRKTFEDAFK